MKRGTVRAAISSHTCPGADKDGAHVGTQHGIGVGAVMAAVLAAPAAPLVRGRALTI